MKSISQTTQKGRNVILVPKKEVHETLIVDSVSAQLISTGPDLTGFSRLSAALFLDLDLLSFNFVSHISTCVQATLQRGAIGEQG
jgi:hypothetical protein